MVFAKMTAVCEKIGKVFDILDTDKSGTLGDSEFVCDRARIFIY